MMKDAQSRLQWSYYEVSLRYESSPPGQGSDLHMLEVVEVVKPAAADTTDQD